MSHFEAPKLGVLGPEGSYSDQVGKHVVDTRQTDWKINYAPTFRQLFKNLDNGEVTGIVVPIENNTAGGVQGLNYLLARNNLIELVGEYRLPIKHSLIAWERIENIGDIEIVTSHPQALLQCLDIIDKNDWEEQPAGSTSIAVKDVVEKSNMAAIAHASALIPGTHVLKKEIQNNPDNLTRFLLLQKINKPYRTVEEWDRCYFFMSTIEKSENRRTAISDAVSEFKKFGVRMRVMSQIPQGKHYTYLVEVYKSEGVSKLLKYLAAKDNLHIQEFGHATLHRVPSK